MGPRALKVRSMCLWSCLKLSSLQNFTRLTQPLLPVWGISSKLRTSPSTPLFLTPFLPSNFLSTTVPAAVTQSALCNVTPQSRFLGQVPCALTHMGTRVDILLMAHHPELWHPSLSCSPDYVPPPSPTSYPWIFPCFPEELIAHDDLWMSRSEFKLNTTQPKCQFHTKHTHTSDEKRKSACSWPKENFITNYIICFKVFNK